MPEGQAQMAAAPAGSKETFSCTWCGARGVAGQHFCQQCGHTFAAGGPETVIGGCHHCSNSWRSGWNFCRKCGADRDSALVLSASTDSFSQRFSAGAELARATQSDMPEVEKIFCKRCGAASKPFSKFCDSCGNPLDGARATNTTGKLKTPPAAASLRTQLDAAQTDFKTEEPELSPARRQEEEPPVIVRGPRYDTQNPKTSALPTGNAANTGGLGGNATSAPSVGATTGRIVPPPPYRAQSPAPPTSVASAARATIPALGSSVAYREARKKSAWPRIAVISLLLLGATTATWAYLKYRRQQPGYAAGGDAALLTQASPQLSNAATSSVTPQGSPLASPQADTSPMAQTSASPASLTVEVAGSVTPPDGMVYVPGGTFEMGRSGDDEYESPPHSVTVSPFFLDRTEVTNEEYQRFIDQTNHRAPTHWKDRKYMTNEGKLPVINVSWNDANDFAAWAKKRLPTEAEWEWAARGADGRRYPWGNEWDPNLANAGRTVGGRIVAVGAYNNGLSPFQALDLCGNVWEWTASKLVSYQDPNRELIPGRDLRVLRGGAYDVPPARATTTYRGFGPPDKMYDKTGFRCARNVN